MEKEHKDDDLEALKEISKQNNFTVIGIDDTFGFKCQQCGKCCMDRGDIILNPFDVYNGAKYLGIKPSEFLDKYCDIDLGCNSKIPIVLLKTTENGFCPLLKYDIKDGGKFKCTIHPVKPGACANHPIGVAYSTNLSTGESTTKYVKVEQCSNSISDEQQTVRDWVQSYLNHQDEIDAAHKIQHLVTNYFNARNFYLSFLFLHDCAGKFDNEDAGDKIMSVLKQYVAVSVHVAYAEYNTDKPFIEQVENNIKSLDDFYTGLKELFDTLSKGFEEKTGDSLEEIIKKLDSKGETTDDSN